AKHGVHPDAGIFAQLDVADDLGGFIHIAGGVDAGQDGIVRAEQVVSPQPSVVRLGETKKVTRAAGTCYSARRSAGTCGMDFLAPGSYQLGANPRGFKLQPLSPTQVGAGLTATMELKLIFSSSDVVTVSGEAPLVETQLSTVSSSIPQEAIEGLPLNGRRFQDLALLTGGVTQDPRSLTSSSNGDLAFGGLRGWHTSFLVDGSDNNNGFFAQARGRYRAPYQFSHEVVQEFTDRKSVV